MYHIFSVSRVVRHVFTGLALSIAPVAAAQECQDLPAELPPVLVKCEAKGILGPIKNLRCNSKNDGITTSFTRRTRGFASGLNYRSGIFSDIDDKSEYISVDSLRGCRGENINLIINPGSVSYFEYQLSAPNDVVIEQNKFPNWRGDQITGKNITLPQSGYYVLRTRTQAAARTTSSTDKQGRVTYYTNYPREFSVKFRTDASVAALKVGEKVDATVSGTQPFIRHIAVPGGSKVRFRFASGITGNFTAIVQRGNGEQLHQSKGPVSFDEVMAVTPGNDEIFTVKAEPAPGVQSFGLQFSILDDKAAGAEIVVGDKLQSVFKLPAMFDAESSREHKTVSASEMARLVYRSKNAERVGLVVRPSGAAGLTVRVRVYDEATEDILVDEVLSKPSTVNLDLPRAATWMVSIAPISAKEMVQAGEAKYTIEMQPGAPVAVAPATAVKRPPSSR